MNYLEEYKKLKEIALEKENNYDEYREDLTYFILEEFIIDILPKAFETGIKNLKLCRISNVIVIDKIKISFNIKDVYPECIYNKKDYNYIGLLEYNKKELWKSLY